MDWLHRVRVVTDSYGRKFAALLVLVMVVTGGVGYSIHATVDTQITEETQRHLTATATSDADRLHSWLALTNQQLGSVTKTSAVRSGDAYAAGDLLVRIANRDAITGTYLANATAGTAAVSTGDRKAVDGDKLRPNVATKLHRTVHGTAGRAVYSEPFRLEDGTPVMLVAVGTPTNDGRAVFSVVDLRDLSEQVARSDRAAADSATVAVINESGTVVLASDPDRILTSNPSAEHIGNSTGFVEQTNDGLAVAYAAVPDTRWVVTNSEPTAEAYALRDTVSEQILQLLGVLLVGLAAIGVTIGRNTVRSVNSLVSKAERLRDGDLEASIESSRNDEIGRLFNAFDEMRRSLRDQIADAERARENAEAARSEAESAKREAETAREDALELSEQLQARATAYSEVMNACADGDLTARMATDAENESMAHIATAYNAMLDEWEDTIREVRTFSESVQAASGTVSENVTAVHDRSAGVKASATEMADGAEAQSAKLETVLGELEDLSATVEEVSTAADTVRDRADEALDRSRNGRTAAQRAATALDEIETSTGQTVTQVEALDELMSEVEAVTDLITDIADQTTMLALNANIEAARAGSGGEGDGFAVVADEVKTLADETVAATEDIETAIGEMREQVERTVEEMHATQSKVATGTETVGEALSAFDGIVDDIEDATTGMREIDSATDEQAASTQEVVSMVEEVGDIGDATAAEATAVADAATEQVGAVDSVETAVAQLSDRADDLGAVLETFAIEEDGTVHGDTDVVDAAADDHGDAETANDD